MWQRIQTVGAVWRRHVVGLRRILFLPPLTYEIGFTCKVSWLDSESRIGRFVSTHSIECYDAMVQIAPFESRLPQAEDCAICDNRR